MQSVDDNDRVVIDMKKYYIMCLIPIVNLFVARMWYYRCVKMNVPAHKQLLRGLFAGICCVPIVFIIVQISAFFQNANINYSLLYFAPAVLNLVMIWSGRKEHDIQ